MKNQTKILFAISVFFASLSGAMAAGTAAASTLYNVNCSATTVELGNNLVAAITVSDLVTAASPEAISGNSVSYDAFFNNSSTPQNGHLQTSTGEYEMLKLGKVLATSVFSHGSIDVPDYFVQVMIPSDVGAKVPYVWADCTITVDDPGQI